MDSKGPTAVLAKRIAKLRKERAELQHRIQGAQHEVDSETQIARALDDKITSLKRTTVDAQMRCVLAKLLLDRDTLYCEDVRLRISETRALAQQANRSRKIAEFVEGQLQAAATQRNRQAAVLGQRRDHPDAIRRALSTHELEESRLRKSIVETLDDVTAMEGRRQLIGNALRELRL